MKARIESTTQMATVSGVPARIWQGVSEDGVPFFAYITRVAVREDHDCTQFERELQEHAPPSTEARAIPARLIL